MEKNISAVISEFVISKFEMDNNIPMVLMNYYNPHRDDEDYRHMISDKVSGDIIRIGNNFIRICKEELTSDKNLSFFCKINLEQKNDGFSISVKWKVLDLTSRTTLKESINSFSLKDEDHWAATSYLVKMISVDTNLAPVFSVYRLSHKATLDPTRSRPISTIDSDWLTKGYKRKIRLSVGTMISEKEIKVDNYDIKLAGKRYTTRTLVSSKTANVEEL